MNINNKCGTKLIAIIAGRGSEGPQLRSRAYNELICRGWHPRYIHEQIESLLVDPNEWRETETFWNKIHKELV